MHLNQIQLVSVIAKNLIIIKSKIPLSVHIPKMSYFVRAGILALAMLLNYSSVRAITLRTLMENQLSADTEV